MSAADGPGGAGRPAAGWEQVPERSNVLALRLMSWIALRCGRRVARVLLHPITLYFVLFAPTARRHARRFLGRALGRPAGWRDVYRNVHAFTSVILDRVYLLSDRLDLFRIEVHGEALIDETLAGGAGAFLVGAHAGSFEVLRSVGAQRAGLRIAMVMYPDNARKINQALQAIAPGYQPQIIALGRSESMLAVRDWLDGGGLAGVLADRALPGESARASRVEVDFLGQPARLQRRAVPPRRAAAAPGDLHDRHLPSAAPATMCTSRRWPISASASADPAEREAQRPRGGARICAAARAALPCASLQLVQLP